MNKRSIASSKPAEVFIKNYIDWSPFRSNIPPWTESVSALLSSPPRPSPSPAPSLCMTKGQPDRPSEWPLTCPPLSSLLWPVQSPPQAESPPPVLLVTESIVTLTQVIVLYEAPAQLSPWRNAKCRLRMRLRRRRETSMLFFGAAVSWRHFWRRSSTSASSFGKSKDLHEGQSSTLSGYLLLIRATSKICAYPYHYIHKYSYRMLGSWKEKGFKQRSLDLWEFKGFKEIVGGQLFCFGHATTWYFVF